MSENNQELHHPSQNKQGAEKIMPYNAGQAKGEQVETMFDSIAPAYDLMNSLMSLGMHTRWRNKALKMALERLSRPAKDVLDVATGTGDLIFALADRLPASELTGIDLSEGMLEKARQKMQALPAMDRRRIRFMQADCLALPFPDDAFDLITVAYGVRNFEDTLQGYREMLRVLRPGGVICVVELACPDSALPLAGYKLYTRGLIPVAGKLISGDSRAYSYLHESIEAAPQRERMAAIMKEAGFSRPKWKALFPGVVCIYLAEKKK